MKMVAIKNMKMPKCCRKCSFKYYDEGEDVLGCALEDGYISDDEADEKRLECCPLVETEERKVGKWVFTKTIFDKYGCTVECPSCHKKWKTYDEIRWKKENKFCPNCGAKMEVEE